MTISVMTFVLMVGVAVVALLLLSIYSHREAMNFVEELQFFLKHRTIAHNRVKAQLSVFKTRFEKLEKENIELKSQIEKSLKRGEDSFSGLLAETEFIEEQNSQLAKLETEISSIQETLKGEFKAQLFNYMKEVDGLSERLDKAREEFSAGRAKRSLETLNVKNVA